MKRTNRIFLLVFCLILLFLTGAAAAQQCVCLDESGKVYPAGTIGTVLCYQYSGDSLVLSGITLQQCQEKNAAFLRQQEEAERQRQQQEAERQRQLEEAEKQRQQEEAEKQRQLEEAERQRQLEEAEKQRQQEEEQRQLEENQNTQNNQNSDTIVLLNNPVNQQPFTDDDLLNSKNNDQIPGQVFPDNTDNTVVIPEVTFSGAPGNDVTPEAQDSGTNSTVVIPEVTFGGTSGSDVTPEAQDSGKNNIVVIPEVTFNGASGNDVTPEAQDSGTNNTVVIPEVTFGGTSGSDVTPDAQDDKNTNNNDVIPEVIYSRTINTDITPEAQDGRNTNTDVTPETQDGGNTNTDVTPEAQDGGNTNTDVTPEVQDGGNTNTDVTPEVQDGGITNTDVTPEAQDGGITNTDVTPEAQDDKKADITATPEAPAGSDARKTEDEPVGMLRSAVYISEGKLDQMVQVAPDGGTLTSAAVTFLWTYTISDPSSPVDVNFNLVIYVRDLDNGQEKTITATVPSASCSNHNCSYTAGSELAGLTKADVTWTISGTYDDGGTPTTVTAQNAGLTFRLDVNAATPTSTMTPTMTPTATMTSTPTMTPTATMTPTPTATKKPKPEAPAPEYPNNRITARSIGFYWKPSKNADGYIVEWQNDHGQKGSMTLSNNDETCKQGRCIAYTTLPGNGHYVWIVTATNSSGTARSKEMRFEIVSNLPSPNPYRPNGTVFNHTYPSFEWEDIRHGAFEYRIQVVGKYDNRIRMDRWYNVRDIYVGNGLCYVQSDLFLPAGSYSWRVMARNNEMTSGWSSWRDFYVECDYCNYNNNYYQNYANTIPTCSYPVGTITVNTPDFQWRTLTGASYYIVTLYDGAGSVLFNEQVSNTNCTAELCSWKPNFKLPKNGNYSWAVSGYGANGSRWGSANTTFTLNAAVVLKPVSFLRPAQNGLLTDDAPVIIWTDPGETTALFHVEIFNSSSTLLFSADLNREQAWCDGQTCSIEFKTIPNAENYRITVTPYSELNTVGEAVSLVFSKGGIPLKLNSPKEGSTVSSRPLFRWSLEAGNNVQYELVLTDANNNVSTFSPLVCGAVGVTCEESEAFFSPSDPLPLGTYSARIIAPGSAFVSEELHFTIR